MAVTRRHIGLLSLLILTVFGLGLNVIFGASEAAPEPAIPALLRAFDNYSIVALGESHWSRPSGEFYLALVRAHGFSNHVNAVVLECGNSRYQPILDRYMDGQDVPYSELSQVWRNTTKVGSWESPIYDNLIRGLHDVNRELPASRRIRVLAADAPIDWSKVRTHKDWEDALEGEGFFAETIEREVLAKNRKALVIMGANHVTHGRNWFGTDDVTSLLEKNHHPVYVAMLWGIPGNNDPQVKAGPVPSLIPLKGTSLGREIYFRRKAEEVADAYIYLGPSDAIAYPDWAALQSDSAYWAELQRRHQIQFGCALDIQVKNQRQKPCR